MVSLARSENVAQACPNATKVHVISGMVKPRGLSKPVGLMWAICRCHRTATLPVTGGSTAARRMLSRPGEAVHFFWIRPCISAFLMKLRCVKMQILTRTQRCVRMVKMQGAEDEGAGSVLKYMTKPEDDSNAADWLL